MVHHQPAVIFLLFPEGMVSSDYLPGEVRNSLLLQPQVVISKGNFGIDDFCMRKTRAVEHKASFFNTRFLSLLLVMLEFSAWQVVLLMTSLETFLEEGKGDPRGNQLLLVPLSQAIRSRENKN